MAGLEATLTPTLLSELREFWFSHTTCDDDLILPDQKHLSRWFFGGEEFDKLCVKHFVPALEAIKACKPQTGQQILDAAKPQSSLDWLSLMVLLDQMPRNCYRGAEAHIAFTIFDPLARDLAATAIERGIPDTDPQIRWFVCRRMWFYLPMMHSEDLKTHEQATEAYARMLSDTELLVSGPPEEGDEICAQAMRVMAGNGEQALETVKSQVQFEKKHLDIIKQFGRYPHRNEALGREPRPEEVEYLNSGGETFGAKPKDK